MPAPDASSRSLDRTLARVASDRSHGASALLACSIRGALRALEPPGPPPTPASWRRWSRRLAEAQPAMGGIVNFAEALHARTRDRSPYNPAALRRWLRSHRRGLLAEELRVVRSGRRRLPPQARILTISNSSIVRRILSGATSAQSPRRVDVLRSEPGGEGATLAALLRRAGVRARCVPDSAADRALRRIDLVLIGADTIYADGSVLHKIGTRALVDLARRRGVPVVVAAGSSKRRRRSPPRRSPDPKRFDSTPGRWIEQVWSDRPFGPARPRRDLPRAHRVSGGRPGTRSGASASNSSARAAGGHGRSVVRAPRARASRASGAP